MDDVFTLNFTINLLNSSVTKDSVKHGDDKVRVLLYALNLLERVWNKSRGRLANNSVLKVADFIFFSLRETVHVFFSKLEFSAP